MKLQETVFRAHFAKFINHHTRVRIGQTHLWTDITKAFQWIQGSTTESIGLEMEINADDNSEISFNETNMSIITNDDSNKMNKTTPNSKLTVISTVSGKNKQVFCCLPKLLFWVSTNAINSVRFTLAAFFKAQDHHQNLNNGNQYLLHKYTTAARTVILKNQDIAQSSRHRKLTPSLTATVFY